MVSAVGGGVGGAVVPGAAREAELIEVVRRLEAVADCHAFRAGLRAGGEQMTVDLMAALRDRIDHLAKLEGRRR